MDHNHELERAQRALRVIRQVSYNVLTGKTTVTSAPVLDSQDSVYYWRTLWGMIWSQSYEGLGESLPDPPPWPKDDNETLTERGELSC